MKLLKIKLNDGKVYTFQTFSLLEQTVMRKESKKIKSLEDEKDQILFESDEKGNIKKENGKYVVRENLTQQQQDKLEELDSKVLEFGIDIFRKAICKNHKEFMVIEDKEKDKEIKNKLMDLVDPLELRKIIQFCSEGVYVKDPNIIEVDLNDITEDDLVDGPEPK